MQERPANLQQLNYSVFPPSASKSALEKKDRAPIDVGIVELEAIPVDAVGTGSENDERNDAGAGADLRVRPNHVLIDFPFPRRGLVGPR